MSKFIWILAAFSYMAFADPGDTYINPFADLAAKPTVTDDGQTKVYGYYDEGCMDGGIPMTPDSPDDWQCMHPERHRCYGTPDMKSFLEYLSQKNGKLGVGDVAQAAGGALIGGHASHETGLDADIRYEILPKGKTLTNEELTNHEAVTVGVHQVNGLPDHPSLESHMVNGAWNQKLSHLLQTAAEYPGVDRIFVTTPLKLELCREFHSLGSYPSWLAKLHPWYGHDDHFHVRLACPPSSPDCKKQKPLPVDPTDPTKVGCAGENLKYWTNSDPTKLKTAENDDKNSTFMSDQIWDEQHPEKADPNKPEKLPTWERQTYHLPAKCEAVKQKLVQQIKDSNKAIATQADTNPGEAQVQR